MDSPQKNRKARTVPKRVEQFPKEQENKNSLQNSRNTRTLLKRSKNKKSLKTAEKQQQFAK